MNPAVKERIALAFPYILAAALPLVGIFLAIFRATEKKYYDAALLTANRETAGYFEAVASALPQHPKLAANWVIAHTAVGGWPLPLRVLASVAVLMPLMTYLVLPWITRRMSWWLHR